MGDRRGNIKTGGEREEGGERGGREGEREEERGRGRGKKEDVESLVLLCVEIGGLLRRDTP